MVIPEKIKKCGHCKKVKSIDEFYKNRIKKGGISSYCKKCNGKYFKKYNVVNKENISKNKKKYYAINKERDQDKKLQQKYGISLKDYKNGRTTPNGICEICGRSPTKQGLVIDHNHKTKQIRGFICQRCNAALGMMEGDIVEETILRLKGMITYLEKEKLQNELKNLSKEKK